MTRFTLLTLLFQMSGWFRLSESVITSPMYLPVLREREE